MSKGYFGWQNDYFDPEHEDAGEMDPMLDVQQRLAAMTERAEAAEAHAKKLGWQNRGQCPLCSAPNTRSICDPETGVRVSYCLHCETAILWQNEVQP
jgi:hypothetical protein